MNETQIEYAKTKVSDFLSFSNEDAELDFVDTICTLLRNRKFYKSDDDFLYDFDVFLNQTNITFKRFLIFTQILGFLNYKELKRDDSLFAKMLERMLEKCID